MSEIEGAKEKVKDTSKELPKEIPKELKIQKIYDIFVLIQNISLWGVIVSLFLTVYNYYIRGSLRLRDILTLPITQAFIFLFLTSLLISILFVIIGLVLSFFKGRNNSGKIYVKKFILRGIIVLLSIFIIYLIIVFITMFFGKIYIRTECPPPPLGIDCPMIIEYDSLPFPLIF